MYAKRKSLVLFFVITYKNKLWNIVKPPAFLIHASKTFLSYSATKIPFMNSFSGNCSATVPISTFVCLWAIYIIPGSGHIFSWNRIGDRWREYLYINRSQTHECGNRDCGRAIPFLEIFVSNFRHWFLAVYLIGRASRNRKYHLQCLFRTRPLTKITNYGKSSDTVCLLDYLCSPLPSKASFFRFHSLAQLPFLIYFILGFQLYRY
jgi:hypothetical protein